MRYFFPAIILIFLLSMNIPVQAKLNKLDKIKENIELVENYLQNLKTMRARFVQTAPDGTKTSGIFYLSRPGKMRFEYDAPIKDFIVADGKRIYFYDAELEQQSNVAIGETLADFILRKDISLMGDVVVTDIKNKKNGTLHITLTQRVDPDAGAMTLIFKKNPMRLEKWVIYDAQGLTTEVALWEIETGVTFKDKNIFRYIDPNSAKPRYND